VGVAVGVAVGVDVGVDATVGMGVSVAESSTGSGEAVQVGAGATVAAELQADRMKAAARAIPNNLRNIFFVTIIHTLSLLKIYTTLSSSYHTANSRSTDLTCVLRIF
jgi:hypothetical protein